MRVWKRALQTLFERATAFHILLAAGIASAQPALLG